MFIYVSLYNDKFYIVLVQSEYQKSKYHQEIASENVILTVF